MIRLVIDRGLLRVAVERHRDGWCATVYDLSTAEGRRYQPCDRSPSLPTFAAARSWAARRLAEKSGNCPRRVF